MSRLESISRHPQRLAAAGVLLGCLASLVACDVRQAASGPAADQASAQNKMAQGSGAPPAPAASQAAGKEEGVKATCSNGNEMQLTVVASDPDTGMQRTKLQIARPDGAVSAIAPPDEMHDYTPVGVSCAVSESDGKPYFVVQYGELPQGCKFCEWFYLYDENGRQLTKSIPVILRDESLPDPQQQYPNNEEYSALAERLRLPKTEMSYVD